MVQPQANEQVENLKGRWTNELPEVLWTYRTTARTSTGQTLFSLAYGYVVMVSMVIGVGSLRRENYDSDQNFIFKRRELNFLEEK